MNEPAPSSILDVQDLTISYRSTSGPIPAVRGVSIQICAGETLALVGETGSGKSTVALAVLGLLENQEQTGKIFFNGHRTQSLTRGEWNKMRSMEIGIVFQDPRSALNPVLTIMDHLMETLGTHQTLSKKAARVKALALLQEVGIQEEQAKLHSFELSGGTCQRAGIALALCNSPRLLIADEPTSSIDTAVQAQILGLLQRMQARYGLALLLISHDLPLISQVSDRVSVMYHGRIVESGLKEEVMAAPAHPYTRSLLQCQPSFLHHHQENPLAPIPGSIPKAGEELPGCAFSPRCSLSEPRCEKSVPAACKLSRTRWVACIHASAGDV
jgi:peptide/nickel transport system ATP-binding protein